MQRIARLCGRPTGLAVASLLTLAATGGAWAQQPADSDPDNPTALEATVVTGSRIKGSEIATQVPVLSISSEDIQATGLTSVGDILQELTAAGSALNTKFNSAGNFGFPPDGSGVGSGSATLDLRHLDPKRVLVLVDGIRWVNESSGSGVSAAVDLNTIPVGIIERIEVLQDGASSLYGSDAIAGVVNIITKRSQRGGHVSVYRGDYDGLSGGATTQVDLSFGATGERYDFFVDFGYVKQNAISASAWGRSSDECIPGTGLANCSSGTPTGRTIFTDANGVTHDVTLNGPIDGVADFPGDFHAYAGANDAYNFAGQNLLLTPSERKSVFVQTRYELGAGINWYARGLYNNRTSLNRAAPEPIFLGPGAGVGPLADATGVDATNPYNPFGITLDADPDSGNLILITRRPVEGGPRRFTQDVDTWYFATGVEGAFQVGSRNFFWDVNYANGNNRATQQVTGTYNIAHIRRALGPVADCTDGCVPLNLFGGPGSITQEMLDYIQYIEHDRSRNRIQMWTANLSGGLVDLPAGPLEFAAGYEHRSQSGSYMPDAVVVAGESNGVPSLPTSGRFSTDEVYLEVNVPLLADVPAFQALDLSASTRHSDYSSFGTATKSKVGLRWQMNDDLTLRSTWAQGFRAPSIGELFGAPARFDATLQDPCNAPIADPQTAANCAALGVPTGYAQSNSQISVRTGGNDALQPETSTSLTVGAVYSPSWADGVAWADRLDFSLGYYRIKLNRAIQASDAQTLLNRCVASGDPGSVFCGNIHRNATGNIDAFDNTLQNLGSVETRGFDFGVSWAGPQSEAGQLRAEWQNTYVSRFIATDDTGNVEPRTVGIEVNDSAIPRLQSTFNIAWANPSWSVLYRLRYISALREDCAAAEGFAICNRPDEIAPNRPSGTHTMPSTFYNDVRATWRLPLEQDLSLTLGVNNLLDKAPPVCVSCSLNGYDASNYDMPARFMYVQAQMNF